MIHATTWINSKNMLNDKKLDMKKHILYDPTYLKSKTKLIEHNRTQKIVLYICVWGNLKRTCRNVLWVMKMFYIFFLWYLHWFIPLSKIYQLNTYSLCILLC